LRIRSFALTVIAINSYKRGNVRRKQRER